SGAFLGGWLADKMGSIAVQKASLISYGGLLIALGQVRQASSILPLIFFLALAAGMLFPANATSMSHVCPPELQVKGFALNRLAGNLGATIGPAVGGILALHNYGLLFWADGLTSLAAAVVFILMWKGAGREIGGRRPPDSAQTGGETGSGEPRPARTPWRDGPFLALMLLFLLWYSIFIQVLTTLPLYMRDVYGLAENRIGQLFAVNTVMIVLFEMILMEKIRNRSRAGMINLSFILLGAGLGLMPLGRGFAFAALTVAVWTVGEMLSMPLVTALIAGRADDATRGRYMGMFSFTFSLAFILAPLGGTAVYGRFGGDALWFGCAAGSLLIGGAFLLLRPLLDRPRA
ncbi:MAG: MFS transporter, partial [Acidobacteriota bacterium]